MVVKRSQGGADPPTRADALLATPIGWAAILGAFAIAAIYVYGPALDGPFVADDFHYVASNPFVQDLTWARAAELLDPRGEAVRLVENYSPVNILLHALEWRLFGAEVRGYHVVNVLLHVIASVLLVALLRQAALPAAASLAGGAIFLLHPANVEAVAWISQLKTSASLVFAMLALLAFGRRPGLATIAFALGLLTKPIAAFALPVLAVRLWCGASVGGSDSARARRWLVVWAALFAAFAVAEMAAFLRATSAERDVAEGLSDRARAAFALVARYATMAVSTYGLSAFHGRVSTSSWLDPRVLGGLVVVVAIAARTLVCLRRRRPEASWWIWAAVAFAPVSQILPFRYPVADRYLYPILPGLIGAAGLAAQLGWSRLQARQRLAGRPESRVGVLAPWMLAALGISALALLGMRSHQRAGIWRSPVLLIADAAEHYPDGIQAHLLRARRAAQGGDPAGAVRELRAAYERGYTRFEQVLVDPVLAPLAGDPGMQRLVYEMAGQWVARYQRLGDLSQAELYSLGVAHQVRGEQREARRAFERALERGGPLDGTLRQLTDAPPSG